PRPARAHRGTDAGMLSQPRTWRIPGYGQSEKRPAEGRAPPETGTRARVDARAPAAAISHPPMASPRRARSLPAVRPPLDRMLRMHAALKAGRHPNASTLAAELEVSRKTVYRDLEFMRDRLGL